MIRTRRTATALTAAAALALGVVPAAFTTTAILAGGEEPTTLESGTTYVPATGTLVLNTATSTVTGTAGTTSLTTQNLVPSKKDCLLTGTENLLQFTGLVGSTGDLASYANGSIGVAEKKSGVSCSEVDSPNEELVVSLGSGVRGPNFPMVITSARLDVDLKQGARILATALLKGEPQAYFELQSAAPLDEGKLVETDKHYEQFLFTPQASDSGPDSGSSDNHPWQIGHQGVQFDTLVLKAYKGSFSLEGGVDYSDAAANASEFNLVEYTQGTMCVGSRYPLPGTSTSPDVIVTRLDNADSTEVVDCVPYSFSKVNQGAELLKPLNLQKSAQFTFDFVWTVPADISPSDPETAALVKRTVVDFDGDGTADLPTVISSCPDLKKVTVKVDGVDKEFDVVDSVATNGDAPDLAAPGAGGSPAGILGKQFACIVSQSIDPAAPKSDGTEQVTVTETIYAYGDILIQKR